MSLPTVKVGGFVAVDMDTSSMCAINNNGSVVHDGVNSSTDSTKINESNSNSMSSSDTASVRCKSSSTTAGHTTRNPGKTDAINQPEGPLDPLCKALHSGKPCATNSGNHRKVISHVFGRNKTSTQQLPQECWILWCRMHYQRHRYRDISLGVWHKRQLEVVRDQLDAFEHVNADQKWEIALRKATQDMLIAERLSQTSRVMNNADAAYDGNYDGKVTCWEEFLTPYTGYLKTFADIRDVLDVIEAEFSTPAFIARDNKDKIFPGVEFLAISTTESSRKASATRNVSTLRSYKQGTMLTPKTAVNTSSPDGNHAMPTLAPRKCPYKPEVTTQPTKQALAPLGKREATDDIETVKPQKCRRLIRGIDLYGPDGHLDPKE